MQPKPFEIRSSHAFRFHMIGDMFANQRQDFFENLAPVLHELHAAAIICGVMRTAQIPLLLLIFLENFVV